MTANTETQRRRDTEHSLRLCVCAPLWFISLIGFAMLMAGCHSSANKNAAADLVVVKATRSGTVQRVLFNEGTNVNEGATLIEIAVPVEPSSTNQNQAEAQARAAISRTQHDISDAEAEVNRAAVEVQRVEPLVAAGTAPQAQLDAAIDGVIAAAARAGVAALTVVNSPAERRTPGALFVATNLIAAAFAGATAQTTPGPEPLVLLPGMLGAAELWDGVAPALAEHAAVRFARIDLDDSVAGMAEGVLAAAPERFALAGHSLGAIVALEVVRQAPERVSRLALLNASARPANEAQLAAWAAMRERVEDGDTRGLVREFAPANLPEARRADSGLAARIEAMADAVGPRGLLRQLSAQATRPDSRPSLGAVRAPTLVIAGRQDPATPPPHAELIASRIPGARLEIVDGAHLSNYERPDEVTALLLDHLEAT